jgi:hypothetical protein
MRIIEGVSATTHIDMHGESLTREGVEDMAKQLNDFCIPMWIQHDPRIPPVGRFIRATTRALPDGELAVVTEAEVWDEAEVVPFLPNRRMPLGKPDHDGIFLKIDRGFSEVLDEPQIEELTVLLGRKPEHDVKKALEPLSILTLGGTFLAGAIASGFVSAMTADVYRLLKVRIKAIIRKRREIAAAEAPAAQALFVFKAFVKDEFGFCLVDVIITDPTDHDLDRFFRYGLTRLDQELTKALATRQEIQRIVIEIEGDDFKIKYGVRSDAVPVKAVY